MLKNGIVKRGAMTKMSPEKIFKMLPTRLLDALERLTSETVGKITEIRMRAGGPVVIKTGNTLYFLEKGTLAFNRSLLSVTLSQDELQGCLLALCNHSVYSHDRELSFGYLSLPGGHRAGVCGTTFLRPDGTHALREVTAINLRIAHEVKGFARKLFSEVQTGGLLIIGAPHTGKTTLLRDYVRLCSDNGETVSLVDCRGEIAAAYHGCPGLDIGCNTDVITGADKPSAIENALRAMAPQMIAFDEIGSSAELSSLRDCMNAGVRAVTTVHAGSFEEFLERNRFLPILNTGAFENIVLLKSDYSYEIRKVGEVLDSSIGCGDRGDRVNCVRSVEIRDALCEGSKAFLA